MKTSIPLDPGRDAGLQESQPLQAIEELVVQFGGSHSTSGIVLDNCSWLVPIVIDGDPSAAVCLWGWEVSRGPNQSQVMGSW